MSTDNKTLADVQPGGMVRLGDAPHYWPEVDRILVDAYAAGSEGDEFDMIAARNAIYAALSAQPSPGGQDVLLESLVARWRKDADEVGTSSNTLCQKIANCTMRHAAELQAVLATRQAVWCGACWQHGVMHEEGCVRQPVGEQRAALWIQFAENGNIRFWTKDQDRALAESFLHARPLTAFYASPQQPAQAADLGLEPMFYIQDTRQFVGNCPMWWGPNGSGYVTRLDEAGRYTEQESIRQNRTRDTDVPWPCSEIDALARQTVDCQHMRPRAERLAELSLIDCQAVCNG